MNDLRKGRAEIDRWLSLAVAIAIIAIAQFVCFCSAAMDAYPGGDYRYAANKHVSHGYDWNHNWLSDLGRARTWSGQENRISARYFNWSIIGLGIGLILFFSLFHRSTDEDRWAAIGMQVCGFVAAFGLIGIGLTPVDLFYIPHHVALVMWVLPMPIMSVFFAYVCFRSAGILGWLAGSVAAMMATVLVITIFFYAMAGSPGGYVVMQKIVVGISIVWFLLLTTRVSLATVEVVTIGRREQIAQQAEEYAATLKQRHLKKRP